MFEIVYDMVGVFRLNFLLLKRALSLGFYKIIFSITKTPDGNTILSNNYYYRKKPLPSGRWDNQHNFLFIFCCTLLPQTIPAPPNFMILDTRYPPSASVYYFFPSRAANFLKKGREGASPATSVTTWASQSVAPELP